MIRIRTDQIRALSAARLQTFEDSLLATMWSRRGEFAGLLEREYLADMVKFCLAFCAEQRLEQRSTLVAFTESMLKDDIHPMSHDHLRRKADYVLRELDARDIYSTIQALQAATAPSTRQGR